MQQKATIRNVIRQIFRQTPEAQLQNWSAQIRTQILHSPIFRQAHNVMLYYALPDEADITSIITYKDEIERTFWFPKIIDDRTIIPQRYNPNKGFTSDLDNTPFHIKEPLGETNQIWPELDLILVPGMAFDNEGHRLGRGKGYYDRFLKHYPCSCKLGICFPYQIQQEIPVDEFDVTLDSIISAI